MASLYTDEVRQAHYDKCRKRAKICETAFSISMWATLFIAVTEILPQCARGFLYGIFIGDLEPFWVMLLTAAAIVFSVYAIFRRDWRFLLGAMLCGGVFTSMGLFLMFGNLLPLPMGVSLIAAVFWRKLEQEDGFPRFEFTFAEQTEQQRLQQSRAEHRAVLAGTHAAKTTLDVHADMSDLLDDAEGHLPAELKNYHNRSLGADAVVQIQKPHGDRMDHLEDTDEM